MAFPSFGLSWGGKLLEGGAIGFRLLPLSHIIYPRGMGAGDIKLAAMVGLMTGYPKIVVALFLAILAGGLAAAFFLLHLKKRTEPVPFGPFLATAAMVTLLWGERIYYWYLGWF